MRDIPPKKVNRSNRESAVRIGMVFPRKLPGGGLKAFQGRGDKLNFLCLHVHENNMFMKHEQRKILNTFDPSIDQDVPKLKNPFRAGIPGKENFLNHAKQASCHCSRTLNIAFRISRLRFLGWNSNEQIVYFTNLFIKRERGTP